MDKVMPKGIKGFQKGHRSFWKGKNLYKETKKKMSEVHKRIGTPWLIGKKQSEETKRKRREKLSGKNHYNWQGGKSFEPYSIDWTDTLRRAIRERDNYICQLCNQCGVIIHHIDYDKKNCNPSNLITLCVRCNSKVNFNRNYWTNYIEMMLQGIKFDEEGRPK